MYILFLDKKHSEQNKSAKNVFKWLFLLLKTGIFLQKGL